MPRYDCANCSYPRMTQDTLKKCAKDMLVALTCCIEGQCGDCPAYHVPDCTTFFAGRLAALEVEL